MKTQLDTASDRAPVIPCPTMQPCASRAPNIMTASPTKAQVILREMSRPKRLRQSGATTGWNGAIDLRVLFVKQLSLLGSFMGRKAELLQAAYRTDVRPLVREARVRSGAAIDPLAAFRRSGYRAATIAERGSGATSTGL